MNKTITILHINDLHGTYDGWLKQAAFLKQRKRELEAQGTPYLLLDAGDHLDMSINECLATRGHLHLDMLAALGVHAMTVGNNEVLRSSVELVRELSAASPVPWLLANLREADGSPIGGMRDSLLLDLGDGIKAGLVGVTDQFEDLYERKHGFRNLDTLTVLREAIADLRGQGANLIVFLSHVGYEADVEIAKELSSEIDVIVGGHSHTVLEAPVIESGVVIVQAGSHARYVGELELTIDVEQGRIVAQEGRLHEVRPDWPEDERQAELLARGRREMDAFFAEELTELDKPLRHEELVQVMAESLRDFWQADIGVLFGAAATDGLSAGTVTKGDVFSVCRSMLTATKLSYQGKHLLGMIRETFNPEITEKRMWGNGIRPGGLPVGRLQFAGLTYELQEDGDVVDVRVNGEPIEEERWYTAGSIGHLGEPDFCYYPAVAGTKTLDIDKFTMTKDVLVAYLRDLGKVTAGN
ncbi:MAG TPA: bifunctional UDP-sugar hydrolase/5'-nucleotidase [Bacilli bacterium]|nr:bifunctional UDP-sugar hydrolase/5'-nucleotidase [Bacilli bacterium]